MPNSSSLRVTIYWVILIILAILCLIVMCFESCNRTRLDVPTQPYEPIKKGIVEVSTTSDTQLEIMEEGEEERETSQSSISSHSPDSTSVRCKINF